ncbi:MAG TPA: CHRD domain-containing protein [Thermoanaerobaculia bacterium]|nr:CHRD domain-containing protein [Thermoanaerobaculia bacterium]
MLRRSLFLFAAVFVASHVAAQTFVFHLRGDQEVPPVNSTASGGCYGVLDQPATTFSLTCVHSVSSATVMHIHRAPAGANGDIAFDLGDPSSPVTATWTGMTPADISQLLAGDLYLNIHTAGRPSGEIRGQILERTVDFVAFTADGAQVVPPNGTASTASCTADLDNAATAMAVQCTHNVVAPDAAHVHDAPAGQVGPTIFTFPSPASPLAANVPLTPQQVASFAATFLYLDVHAEGTEEEPGDEIRGQIGVPPVGATSGTIIIRKETFPAGGSGFTFDETITSGNFALNDGGSRTFSNVTPGTYTVVENDPAAGGYTLADLRCDDADSGADTFTRSAAIRVGAGETVTCTFRNFETAPTDELFVFHLSGDQEVPPVNTPDRGGCMGRFDAAASELSLVCTHDVDLPTVMHIHRAPAGSNGDIVFDLGEPASPVIATWSAMTPAEVADLMAGNFYVNIHTSGRPSGEIRGQIVPRTVDTVAFELDTAQVVPPGTSSASGDCTANLNDPATQLAVSCTHDLANPDEAHVHDAPRGENGPVVHTFTSPDSPFAQNVPLTPRLVADFAASFLYVDIHADGTSEDIPGDQIRGQIGAPPVVVATGTIRIVKSTSPAGGTGFTFTDDIPGSAGAFTLHDGEVETFADVVAGTYTVTEGLSAGYSLTDVVCGDSDSTGNPFDRNATIRLQGGETVTCTFRNLQTVAAPQHFVFHMSADQEVLGSDSTARGGCYGQLNAAAATFSLVCTHNVIGAGVAHIHRAPAGENGDIVFELGDPASPIEATWTGMAPEQIADLLAGNYYVNIHASGRPDGEIRGQILPRTVDNFSFPATAAQEIPPTDSTATGNCFADLSDDAQSLFVQCTHNVDQVIDNHLHAAPPGVDGVVVFHYPATNPFSGTTPLTPRLIADFAAGFLYVNIHSTDYDTGEIRGQLIAGAPAPGGAAAIPTAGTWALMMLALGLAVVAWRRM